MQQRSDAVIAGTKKRPTAREGCCGTMQAQGLAASSARQSVHTPIHLFCSAAVRPAPVRAIAMGQKCHTSDGCRQSRLSVPDFEMRSFQEGRPQTAVDDRVDGASRPLLLIASHGNLPCTWERPSLRANLRSNKVGQAIAAVTLCVLSYECYE